ncbi:MAG: CoA-binding protein [Promethearchaeota archaeon]
MPDFNRLFNPRAIGIIGVSDKAYGGGFFLRALQAMPFDKPIYIFNPRLEGQTIKGLFVYGSILDIPMEEPIDYVIIAVPAKLCPAILEEVGKKEIPFVTIFTSGFSEVGKQSLESDLLKIAKKYGIKIIGPNCLGIYVPQRKISFSSRLNANSGNFGMILQSGGLAIQMSSMASSIYGNSISKAISIGNQIDLNFVDFLEYFLKDEETRVIGLYIENLKNKDNGQNFKQSLKNLALKKKPVIIWKVGSGESSREAIISHTGGLAGSQAVWEGVTRQTGAILVKNAEEFQNLAMTFHYLLNLSIDRKVGVISIGGGASIQITDILEQYNIIIPTLVPETRENILQFLPGVNTIVRNPLDLGSSGINPEVFYKSLIALDRDPNISAIVFGWVINFDERILKYVKKAYYEMKKPFICVAYKITDDVDYYSNRLQFKKEMFQLKIPVYESIEALAKSLDKLCTYQEYLKMHLN